MAECFGPIAEKNGLVWTEFAKAMKMLGWFLPWSWTPV